MTPEQTKAQNYQVNTISPNINEANKNLHNARTITPDAFRHLFKGGIRFTKGGYLVYWVLK